MPLFLRDKSSLKGRWRLETVQDIRSSSSNPVSCSETSIKIYGSKEEIRARKSPETVDAPGFAPDASIPVTLYGADDQIRTDYLVLTKDALYLLSYISKIGRGRRIRTLGTWFWRPLLYQLSYTPISRFEGVSIQCQQTRLYTKLTPLSTTLSLFFTQSYNLNFLVTRSPAHAGHKPPKKPAFMRFSVASLPILHLRIT